mmetsp:Transcript_4869/g.14331  ORF Transcript_4869/g.14331 Transcript_4869/m.14331 type:complete len:241 (-) Transcript_4869:830-1552(-)
MTFCWCTSRRAASCRTYTCRCSYISSSLLPLASARALYAPLSRCSVTTRSVGVRIGRFFSSAPYMRITSISDTSFVARGSPSEWLLTRTRKVATSEASTCGGHVCVCVSRSTLTSAWLKVHVCVSSSALACSTRLAHAIAPSSKSMGAEAEGARIAAVSLSWPLRAGDCRSSAHSRSVPASMRSAKAMKPPTMAPSGMPAMSTEPKPCRMLVTAKSPSVGRVSPNAMCCSMPPSTVGTTR